MKILFTADLHLNIPAGSHRTGRIAFDEFAEVVGQENPEVVVVAGDIGTPMQSGRHLAAIRNVVGDRFLAVTLGNHDFWLASIEHAQFSCLDEVVTRFWQDPVREAGAVLLDRENVDLGEFVIAGGYGHFDLGLAEPNLRVGGKLVTETIYLSGAMNSLVWNDFRYIPNCGTRVQAEAREQAAGLACRMDAAISAGKRLLVATHTCPWRELNGHPMSGNEFDILSAYSGNSLVGKELEARAPSIDFLMCGHTHIPVRERKIHGIDCLNVGADYGVFRGILYHTENRQVKWVGEPLPAQPEH